MRTALIIAGFFFIGATVFADDDVASGPSVGDNVQTLKVFAVTGVFENKEVNYTEERKDKPTIYCFVNSEHWTRPMAQFLKTLEKDLRSDNPETEVVAVWMYGDADKNKEYLPKVQQSLQFASTALAYWEGEKAGPKGWNINDMAHLTVVIAHKGKFAAVRAYKSVNATDAATVREDLKKVTKKS